VQTTDVREERDSCWACLKIFCMISGGNRGSSWVDPSDASIEAMESLAESVDSLEESVDSSDEIVEWASEESGDEGLACDRWKSEIASRTVLDIVCISGIY